MNKLLILISTLILYSLAMISEAAIYKSVDADGHVTYSNVKIKGSKKIDLGPTDTSFGTKAQNELKLKDKTKASAPSDFPSVDNNTQKQRDQSRKEILLSELASEKAALENAKKAYEEGASNPEVFKKKNADGSTSTFRNVAKYQEKLKQLQMNIDVHQRNVELLEKEISTIN
jgi:hypothetical protein